IVDRGLLPSLVRDAGREAKLLPEFDNLFALRGAGLYYLIGKAALVELDFLNPPLLKVEMLVSERKRIVADDYGLGLNHLTLALSIGLKDGIGRSGRAECDKGETYK
ncbi:MAG: hypothetical protein ACRD22_18920, partial [Terriglobia bacterium]